MARRILISLAMVLLWSPLAGDSSARGGKGSFVPNQVIVGFRKETSDSARAATLNHNAGFHLLKQFKSRRMPGSALDKIYLLELPPGIEVDRAIADLEADPLVEYAHPNHVYRAQGLPNDPNLPTQWGFMNTGAALPKGPDLPVAGSDTAAGEALDLIQSLGLSPQPIIVAVIDTGIALTHPDLAANLWINEAEIAANGIDDDGNGYIDDRHGYDFANNDSNPADGNGHGTHLAGTIGAVCGNGIGVCGLTPNARLMAVKTLDDSGSGNTADVIDSIIYAVDNGALVLTVALEMSDFEPVMYDVITGARDAGVLVAAAAGNDRADTDAESIYPAAYDVQNVVSVGASTAWREMAEFSNRGLFSVDLAAPGEAIISTQPLGFGFPPSGYDFYSGTSMAAAAVSAALALAYGLGDEFWPVEWGSWSPAQKAVAIRERLLARSERWPALDGLTATSGHVNMANLISPDTAPPSGVAGTLSAHTIDAFRATLHVVATGDDGTNGSANYYDLRYQAGPDLDFETATPAPGLWTPRIAGEMDTLVVSGLEPGTQYTFGIKVIDEAGNASPISELLTASTVGIETVFADDMESGAGSWTTTSTGTLWSLSTVSAHSPTHAWSDSPGNYPNNRTAILQSPEIDTDGQQATVIFWQRYAIEEDFDFGYAESRQMHGGIWSGWSNRATFTGIRGDWHRIAFTLTSSDAIQVRFRLVSDPAFGADGWMIDDFDVVPTPAPTTMVLDDDFTDSNGWVLSGTWGIETGTLSDSPGTNYPLNNRSSARLSAPLDLSLAGAVEISFQFVSFSFENNFDFLHLQYSLDGTNWRTLHAFTGAASGTQTLEAGILGGQPAVYFRFMSSTDSSVAQTGARIDNFQVRVAQSADLCPLDPLKIEPGVCGCGLPDGGLDCQLIFYSGFESQ